MRRFSMLIAAVAVMLVSSFGFATPSAHAVCGGGGPGEPCFCPSFKNLIRC